MKTDLLKIVLTVIGLLVFLGFYFLRAVQAEEVEKGLVIVTTENIRLNSSKLDEFITEKEKRGFSVKIATEKDFGGKDVKGYEKAVLIRFWLKENGAGYPFLLLIGDPNPKMGDVPMVITMPGGPDAADPCADAGYSCTKIPTDYYYSDLSGEFDLNEDGVAGQAPMDLEAGGIDFNAEMYAGWIPVYFGDVDELDATLGHVVSYMKMNGDEIQYRKRMLFPMSFIWFDGYKVFQTMHENKETAETSEWFIRNVLKDHSDISYTRLYEAEGHYPSLYEFERSLNRENIVDEWKNGYGMIFWGGHGMPTGVARTVWLDDVNGNELGENDEVASYDMITSGDSKDISVGKPGFVVAISCLVGNIDAPGSITHKFLADGAAVGIISASSVTDPSSTKWTDFSSEMDLSTVSEDTAGVVFFEGLINGGYAGKIFYDYKYEFGKIPAGRVLDHKYMLNYFGDPTLTLYDIAVTDVPDDEVSDEGTDGPEETADDENEGSSGGCSMVAVDDTDRSLIIVTTELIKNTSKKLSGFIKEKESRGFDVLVATEKDYGGDGVKGQDRAVIIRDWLKKVHKDYSFLLLIGDANPLYGDIPMVKGWARHTFPENYCGGFPVDCRSAETDYFYADLTGNWDLNGNGKFGEHELDDGEEGIDFKAELFTGRIPVYFNDTDALDTILENAIVYMNQKDTEIDYRKKMLFPATFYYFKGETLGTSKILESVDGAAESEWYIENRLKKKYQDIEFKRLYEKEGLIVSKYEPDIPVTEQNLIDEWKKGYGLVWWHGHGQDSKVARTVWKDDHNNDGVPDRDEIENPLLIQTSGTKELTYDKRAFVLASSCEVGSADVYNNLAFALLLNGGAVGVIGSSSVTPSGTFLVEGSEPDHTYFGLDPLGVFFFDSVIEGRYPSKALYEAKNEIGTANDIESYAGKYMLNYFGDPTLTLYDTAIDETSDEEVADEEKNDTELETVDDFEESSGGCSMVAVDNSERSLLIVTTEYIKNTSKKLSEFIAEKKKRGFSVNVGTENDFGGEDLQGQEKALLIKDWLITLKNEYKYLLLIGDPNPRFGDLPMLSAYTQGPDGGDYAGLGFSYIPTDQIYRSPEDKGDCDGNDLFYEYYGDGGYECAGFEDTFITGRIPVYFNDIDELDAILDHTLKYMNQSDENKKYRTRILFPMAFVWFDGYNNFGNVKKENREISDVSEWLIENILPDFKEVTFTRMYETEGHFSTKYQTDIPLTNENLISEWGKNGYGMIFWGGHGQSNSVARTIWAGDENGNELAENSEVISKTLIQTGDFKGFSGKEPGFVIALSCLVGDVTVPGNISYDMLLKGASVGVISSTFIDSPSYNTKFEDIESDLSDKDYTLDLIGIHTIDRALRGIPPAEVLADLRNEIGKDPGVRVFEHKIMMHYYGDPTLTLYETAVEDIPDDEVSDEGTDVPEEIAEDENEGSSGGCSMIFN